MKFCTQCGAPVEAGASFCTKCGASFAASGPFSPAPAPNVKTAPNRNYASAKTLSTVALIVLAAAMVLSFLGSLFFYISIDQLRFLWAVLPGLLITALISAIIPVFCKIAVSVRAVSCAGIIKICTIVFLAVQIITAIATLIIIFVDPTITTSPLFMIISRIPGAGLLRTFLSLFAPGNNASNMLSAFAGTLSNTLLVGNNILCFIAAYKLGKS